MPKVLVSDKNLTNIANAIREKNGETTTYKPGDMATAIQNISSGGGGDSELEASFMSSIDSSKGANCTKLPDGLTSISDYAFYNCSDLALTKLPDSVTSIGGDAFENCTNLALTELPNSITSIAGYAFQNCTNLALTKLPSELTIIRASTFNGCKNLALTELPRGITIIDSSAFANCSKLALTELPSSITGIHSQAFSYCTSLSQITINSNTLTLASKSFGNCTNLKKIVLPNIITVPSLKSSTFSGTPIASGTGYIYVPDTLVDSFKTATNWSTYADQIKPISELEASV